MTTEGRGAPSRTYGLVAVEFARGVAIFLGFFSLANSSGLVLTGRSEDLWWVDVGRYPPGIAGIVGAATAALMLVWGFGAPIGRWARSLLACSAAVLACLSAWDAGAFYMAWQAGLIEPAAGVPFSALLAVVLLSIALAVARGRDGRATARSSAVSLAVAVVVALAFPVAHVYTFGTTDYRRPADAAVVFGARVNDDGSLSSSLRDRVDTGVSLYREGLVDTVVMSGGVGPNGISEARAMSDHAIGAGVDAADIVIDEQGADTDATVTRTRELLGSSARVLAVSHFYHLPRIKMAYRAAGTTAYTVPAHEQLPIAKTPLFVVREIPAFWLYWGRGLLRGVSES